MFLYNFILETTFLHLLTKMISYSYLQYQRVFNFKGIAKRTIFLGMFLYTKICVVKFLLQKHTVHT